MKAAAPGAVSRRGEGAGDGRPAYEVCPLVTPAARAEAAALVEDRIRMLTGKNITPPCLEAAAVFLDDRTEAVGLYENDEEAVLAGCLVLHRDPDCRHWDVDDPAPELMVSLAHTAPGRDDRAGWRMTMWLRDYAARLQAPWVYAEAPGWPTGADSAAGRRLLSHLRDLGWEVLGHGRGRGGHRVARLRLAASTSPGLSAMIHCTVPLRAAGGPEPRATPAPAASPWPPSEPTAELPHPDRNRPVTTH